HCRDERVDPFRWSPVRDGQDHSELFRTLPRRDAIAAWGNHNDPPPVDSAGDELVRERVAYRDDAIRTARERHRAQGHVRKRHDLRTAVTDKREVWKSERGGNRVDNYERRTKLAEPRGIAPVAEHDGRHANAALPQCREHVAVVEISAGAPRGIARGYKRNVRRSRAPPGPSRPPGRRGARRPRPRARTGCDV